MIVELNIPLHARTSTNLQAMRLLFDCDARIRYDAQATVVSLDVPGQETADDLCQLLCEYLDIGAIAMYIPQQDAGCWAGPRAGGRMFNLATFARYEVAQTQQG
jgi:hypothetical protein